MSKARKICKEKNYSEECIDKALNAIKNGISLRKAAKTFGVPKSTLYVKKKNKCPVHANKGPATVLTKNEENLICEWIFECSSRGFPVTKDQLLNTVQKFVIDTKKEVPFRDGRPGRHWYESFKHRHPDLAERLAQNLTYSRASVTEEALRQWFEKVRKHLETLDLLNIDPSRVFNCDETAFFFCPKPNQVIVKRGLKAVYKIINGNERQNLTVLFMVRGDGIVIPPMVIFPYQRMPYTVSKSVPKDWFSGVSEKGWMTSEGFYEYVANCFYPWLRKNNVKFPVILYVDGHSSHITYPLCQFCKTHKIELIALFPNSTHILQPLDIAVFHPLKSAYKKNLEKWRLDNHLERVKNETFCSILAKAMESVNFSSIVQEGFRAAGLIPFNPDSVNYNILNKMKNKELKDQNHDTIQYNEENLNLNSTNQDLLKDFENALPINILQDFKNAESSGNWKVNEEQNDALFHFWIKFKK